MNRSSSPVPWLLIAAAVACWATEFSTEGSFERTLQVTGPTELEIRTGSGRIEVRRGDSATVRIRAVMRARSDWLGGRPDAEEEIRRLEANPPFEQSGNVIRIDRRPRDHREGRIQISYEVTAPAGTRVRAHSGSGSIALVGPQGDVQASTGSGRVEISSLSGSLRARSGSVRLRIPQQAGFELRARTGSGRVTCDHPLTVRGTIGRRSLSGRVREGGPLLEVSTGSGGIHVE